MMVVLVRYWFFGIFVMALSATQRGGIKGATRTSQPLLQIFRGALLALEMMVMLWAMALVGLVEAHALFACHPLLVTALSGIVLGENAGWQRWCAVAVGFIGVLIIINPGSGVFSPWSIAALASAAMFALYNLLTRYAARRDSAETSFFWTGTAGAATASVGGVWFWQPMIGVDWLLMAVLCVSGAAGHYLLIKCYEKSEANAVQPFAYFHLVFASVIGLVVFSEPLAANVAIGCLIVVLAGLFTLWRQRVVSTKVGRGKDRLTN